MTTQQSKETRVVTELEWQQAWEAFNSACRQLSRLADLDQDFLKIDIKYQPGGRKVSHV
jgi:hypothetical protein